MDQGRREEEGGGGGRREAGGGREGGWGRVDPQVKSNTWRLKQWERALFGLTEHVPRLHISFSESVNTQEGRCKI